MKIFLSFLGAFVLFVLFLSVEIKGKPIFSHVYNVISPVTKSAQNAAEDFFSKSFDKTENYSKKLFDNSVPRVKDSVKSKLSSRKKIVGEPEERIMDEEKKKLDQLIKNH